MCKDNVILSKVAGWVTRFFANAQNDKVSLGVTKYESAIYELFPPPGGDLSQGGGINTSYL